MTRASARPWRVLLAVAALLVMPQVGAAHAAPAALPCSGTAPASVGGAVAATFSDGGCFEGGRVARVKEGYRVCRSTHGVWRFNECSHTYQWYYPYLQYRVGTAKPASCG